MFFLNGPYQCAGHGDKTVQSVAGRGISPDRYRSSFSKGSIYPNGMGFPMAGAVCQIIKKSLKF